jgi:hypothetical protein
MVHKIDEAKVKKLEKEISELKQQEELLKKQKALQKELGKEKFWMKHHTLKETVEGVKAGTKGYLVFIRKDIAPAMVRGMKSAVKEWKKGKPLSDEEIRKKLKE